MYNTLKPLCNEKRYVAIYDDCNDTSKFKFGVLLCVDDAYFALASITPNGDYDGIVVDETDDVFRVDCCGNYHNKMAKLSRICKDALELPVWEQGEIIKSLLRFAQKVKRLISFELSDSGIKDISGFVEDISECVCKVHAIDEYGFDDGYSYIDMDSITQITFDSEDEQRIARLYNLRQ